LAQIAGQRRGEPLLPRSPATGGLPCSAMEAPIPDKRSLPPSEVKEPTWSKPTAHVPDDLAGHFITLEVLREAYGWKLLGMLAFAQWGIKGMVWGYAITTSDFLLREYAVTGPKMQVYKAVAMLPFAMKPLFGLLSDALPICGYHKAPYIAASTFFAVLAYVAIGFSPEGLLQVRMVVFCLLLGTMQVSIVDLLTEARYAEKIRERPEHGPDLMTYVWGGLTAGQLLATASVGIIIEHFGPSVVYAIIAMPAAVILVPTCLNWLEEERITESAEARRRSDMVAEQPELLALVLIVGGSSLLLVIVGLMQDSIWVNLGVALTVAVVVLCSFGSLLHPVIGLTNCFFFIQTCFAFDISGAAFYFFTDDATQYPEGPHFSKMFFASGLGVAFALLNLLGMAAYNRYMKTWRYHGLFYFANLLLCIISLLGLCVYLRWNVRWGIPDAWFVLCTNGAWGIVHMWMWLPGIVMMSHMCPKGVEATMYALLAGCHNLGSSVASYSGACLLDSFSISPRGEPAESHQFKNLWIAALISALAPTLTLAMMPWMVPNARQTESFMEPHETATAGSLWQRWRARDTAESEALSSTAASSAGGKDDYGAVRSDMSEGSAP